MALRVSKEHGGEKSRRFSVLGPEALPCYCMESKVYNFKEGEERNLNSFTIK